MMVWHYLSDHTVRLVANYCYLKHIRNLHVAERTVRGVMNWTIAKECLQLLSFLGGFLQISTKLRVVNFRESKNSEIAVARNVKPNEDLQVGIPAKKKGRTIRIHC
jgi:hypothetical protein